MYYNVDVVHDFEKEGTGLSLVAIGYSKYRGLHSLDVHLLRYWLIERMCLIGTSTERKIWTRYL